YKNALRYKPDYPEGINDMGALHLEKDFADRNVPEALRYHNEALALLPKSEQQRKKLCSLFGKRWELNGTATEAGALDSDLQKLLENHCTCVAHKSKALLAQAGQIDPQLGKAAG